MSLKNILDKSSKAMQKIFKKILRTILFAVGILVTLFINYIFYRIWVGQSIFPWWGP